MGESGIGKSTLVSFVYLKLCAQLERQLLLHAPNGMIAERRFYPGDDFLGSIFKFEAVDVDGTLTIARRSSRVKNDPRILERLPLLDGVLG